MGLRVAEAVCSEDLIMPDGHLIVGTKAAKTKTRRVIQWFPGHDRFAAQVTPQVNLRRRMTALRDQALASQCDETYSGQSLVKSLSGRGQGGPAPGSFPYHAPPALQSPGNAEGIGGILCAMGTSKVTVCAKSNPLCCTDLRKRPCARAGLVRGNLLLSAW